MARSDDVRRYVPSPTKEPSSCERHAATHAATTGDDGDPERWGPGDVVDVPNDGSLPAERTTWTEADTSNETLHAQAREQGWRRISRPTLTEDTEGRDGI